MHFAGLPPEGTPASTPANGRIILNISPASGATWNVYADGRIIWQRYSRAGDPLVIPNRVDPLHTGLVQQRLTPQGVRLLRSRILAIGQPTDLFRHNLALGRKAFEKHEEVAWYQVRTRGHLIYAQVLPPSLQPRMATVAQMRALARINALVANSASRLPAGAWADRTIRPYVPSHYQLVFDRFAPDPAKLASPAREMLREYQPLLDHACQVVTTEQARALFAALGEAGVKLGATTRKKRTSTSPP